MIALSVGWGAVIALGALVTVGLMLPALIVGRRDDATHHRLEGDRQ